MKRNVNILTNTYHLGINILTITYYIDLLFFTWQQFKIVILLKKFL